MIRLLVVDDQAIVRQGLKKLLEYQPDLTVVGEAADGREAVSEAIRLRPDVVLMDVRMPVLDGVEATRELTNRLASTCVLVLTTFDDDEYVRRALLVGARGYLLKDTPPEEIAQAIRAVAKGYTQIGPGLHEKALLGGRRASSPPAAALAGLTAREREVLSLIATGASNREIGEMLFISERTVKNHVTSILAQLNLRDRTQVAVFILSLHNHDFLDPI